MTIFVGHDAAGKEVYLPVGLPITAYLDCDPSWISTAIC